MKKKFFIFLYFFAFSNIACVYHNIENAEEETVVDFIPPVPQAYNAEDLDGHYNTRFTILENTCPDIELLDSNEKVDFFSYDNKSGMIVFDNKFYWDWVEIDINENGSFHKLMPFSPFEYGSWWGFELETEGLLKDNQLDAQIIYSLYKGDEKEKMDLFCYVKYQATGYKRYQPLKSDPQDLRGEYKTIVEKKDDTCKRELFLDKFATIIKPQLNGKYNFKVDLLEVFDLTLLPGGHLDETIKQFDTVYIFQGKISPDKFSLRIEIYRGGTYSCHQKYDLVGQKRFEEANNPDNTIDGIFTSYIFLKKNTCDSKNLNIIDFIDVIQMPDNKANVSIGNKTFELVIGENGIFKNSTQADDDYQGDFQVINEFAGTVTPQSLRGVLTIKVKWPEFECEYIHSISGSKLYQHN